MRPVTNQSNNNTAQQIESYLSNEVAEKLNKSVSTIRFNKLFSEEDSPYDSIHVLKSQIRRWLTNEPSNDAGCYQFTRGVYDRPNDRKTNRCRLRTLLQEAGTCSARFYYSYNLLVKLRVQ